ncbi:hypothetical protein O181_009630 [Austropuccinia psidii MF-1]|uniref:Protein HGH1 homolog n=1 Tax=Austropuccinia psidii MF-1 TaxID=1389203 RepID=A0A9Q3GK38_9BASI|nr:hypothetical protein [Austropuccinia psidii MF-1]
MNWKKWLIGFLHDRNPHVRRLAVQGLLPYTLPDNPRRQSLFITTSPTHPSKQAPVKDGILNDLKRLCEDQHVTAHDAFSALINLTDTEVVMEQLADPDFLAFLFFTIIDRDSILADLACMLWSNLTKFEPIIHISLDSAIPPHSDFPAIEKDRQLQEQLRKTSTPLMDLIIELFARGDRKKLNPHANFDFLASVWANFSASAKGRDYLVGFGAFAKPTTEAPLAQLTSFTEHPSLIRRGGVISSIKNCCFATHVHHHLLAPTGFNLLPPILLPLIGPEPSDDPEDEKDFPLECQMPEPDKRREADANLRLILIEALILLATYPLQREIMRKKKVYRIIQVLHLHETSELVQEAVERLVNLLMRDESNNQEQISEEDQLVEV